MTTEMAKIQPMDLSLDRWHAMESMAKTLLASGFLPVAVDTPAKAIAIIQAGYEVGIPPMQALRSINVIQGKPAMGAELMLALAYSRVRGFACEILRSNAEGCALRMRREGIQWQEFSFLRADADRANLLTKQTWKQYPQAMYRARAISAALRVVAPDAIAGIYTPEEMGAEVVIAEDGTEIVSTPAELTQPRIVDEGAPAREERAAERQKLLDGAPPIPEGSGTAHDKVILALGKRATEAEVDEWHAAFKAGRAKLSANAENSAFDRRVAWDVEERKRGIRATAALAEKVRTELEAEKADPRGEEAAQAVKDADAEDLLDDSEIPF